MKYLIPLFLASIAYPMTYAGGSLPLKHNKVQAAVGTDAVVFVQNRHRIAVPVKNITEISCAQNHYIGLGWTDATKNTARSEVVLKLDKGEYRQVLTALERSTGKKAVDTNQVPSVVRYGL